MNKTKNKMGVILIHLDMTALNGTSADPFDI